MKKVITFLTVYLGGSVIMFISLLAGCGKRHYRFFYTEMTSNVWADPLKQQIRGVFAGDTCGYSEHLIDVTMDIDLVAYRHNPDFGNQVNAFQPADPVYENVEPVSEVRIISLYDYNVNFSAGDDISARCTFGTERNRQSAVQTESEIVDLLNRYDGPTDAGRGRYAFIVEEPPAATGPQQFALEVRTAQNTVLRDTTIVFVLKK